MYIEKDSYGGFLPLELYHGTEYFADYPESCISRYNSGTTALYAAILSLGKKRVWVPYFYCPSVWEVFHSDLLSDHTFLPYHIGEDLMPKDISQEEDDAVIVVNYYGVLDQQIRDYIQGRKNIIVDNAQAFFCPPVMEKTILNVYSCRKYIGVADGAYLIGMDQIRPDLPPSFSGEHMGHVIKSIESGTNAVYSESLENEKRLARDREQMSVLTQAILKGTNYSWIEGVRKRNFEYVQERLVSCQQLQVKELSFHAYCYPLLCKKDYRKALIERKIYVPTLWKELIVPEFEGLPEYTLSKNCLCLPVDQRYDVEDMEHICKEIIELMQE